MSELNYHIGAFSRLHLADTMICKYDVYCSIYGNIP